MLVFVSYCLRDFPLVKSLILQLGVLGHNVQYEPKMPAGQIHWNHVLDSINQCDVFLLALTDNALQSASRALELQAARGRGKPVLPVLISEITVPLPSEFSQAFSYISETKESNDNLAHALQILPRVTQIPEAAAEPDWFTPLMKIHSLIREPRISLPDQRMIALNLQEFLERQETYRPAKSLLKSFAGRRDIDPSVQADVKETARQIKQSQATQQRARLRNSVIAGFFVLAILIVIGFLLYRRQMAANRDSEATLTMQSVGVTQTGFVLNKDMTSTIDSLTSTAAAHQTETAIPSASPTPTLDPRFMYQSIFPGVTALPTEVVITPQEPVSTDIAATPTVIVATPAGPFATLTSAVETLTAVAATPSGAVATPTNTVNASTAVNTTPARDATATRTLLPPVTLVMTSTGQP